MHQTKRMEAALGLAALLALGASTAACGGGGQESMTPASANVDTSEERELLERAAIALETMRADNDFRGIDAYLSRAQGVVIFPKLKKASFIVGGEGGSGVLVAKTANGWSPPAFYKLRSGSAGLQIGYQESTVVLAFMSRSALERTLEGGFKLGADATVAAGNMGDAAAQASTRPGADVVQFVEAGGVFAGVSLNGASISARDDYNSRYYGKGASPRSIVLGEQSSQGASDRLGQALPPPAR